MDIYNFIKDEKEMEWFFNHVLDDLSGDPYHSYLMCITARPKKLTQEERIQFGISGSDGVMLREEIIAPRGKEKIWNFANFKQHIARYECNKEGMITKTGLPYPQKSLSVMFYCEPSDERMVSNFILNYGATIQKELNDSLIKGSTDGVKAQLEKLTNLTKKLKSCHAENTAKRYIHFDFDIRKDLIGNEEAAREAANVIHSVANSFFGKGSTFIIRTFGGFHVLVKNVALMNGVMKLKQISKEDRKAIFGADDKKIGTNPINGFIFYVEKNYSYTFEEEDKLKQQKFVPLPGSNMYDNFTPCIINKEDFE
jgi:hypothetical protein